MLTGIRPQKLKNEKFRATVLEVYYENLFEKNENYDKLLDSFQKLVAGFSQSRRILSDEADESLFDIQRKLKKLHNESEDRQKLWSIIEQFFSDNLETDVEEALKSTEYPEGVE